VKTLDAVVVGAGTAGLAASQYLAKASVDHIVLERDRVGESWRSQRWDSFALNTPGWTSRLPGDATGAGPDDEFAPRDAFVSYLDRYAQAHDLPIRTGVTVTRAEPRADGGFVVHADGSDPIIARSLVVAAGTQRSPRIPDASSGLRASVTQVHSSAYRNPAQLPAGAVLVVGAAQSGGQIAEDLLDAGRSVYVSTSRVGRIPRRYRGRDCFGWLIDLGFLDQTVATLPDPAMQFAAQPIISGVGQYGHTLSLQHLAERGAHLLGRVSGAAGGRLTLTDDLGANIAWGDARSTDARRMIDAWIAKAGVDAPPPEPDPADAAHPDPESVHSPGRLDFDAAGISTVIWTTGVKGEFGWLPPTALASDGFPLHTQGISPVPGLYYLGLPWQRNRASGIIAGAAGDAAHVVDHLVHGLRPA